MMGAYDACGHHRTSRPPRAHLRAPHYTRSFETLAGNATYRRLRAQAREVIELPFGAPSEEAYWAAGQRVVGLAEVLLAVWDGTPSQGVGGTADVVAFAGERGVPTTVVWPPGSRRG
jgi:hypothetical protein